jgi:hypothetical protein
MVAAAAVFSAGVVAQVQRNFPANALRGELTIGQAPEVMLNGEAARLAPGARVRGQDNMVQMSGSLSGSRLVVNYTIDGAGQVKDVWILRPEEAAVRPWPRTPEQAQAWQFDVGTQTWTRP